MTKCQEKDQAAEAEPEADKSAEDYAAAYRQHANTLRSWFIAYGAGGPILLLGNEKMSNQIRSSNLFVCIACCFLTGILLQVMMSFFDKYSNWILFRKNCKAFRNYDESSKWINLAEWWSNNNFPSVFLEFFTVLMFTSATILTIKILM